MPLDPSTEHIRGVVCINYCKKLASPSSPRLSISGSAIDNVCKYSYVMTNKSSFNVSGLISINSLSASLLLNIFLSFEVGIAHAIANFK